MKEYSVFEEGDWKCEHTSVYLVGRMVDGEPVLKCSECDRVAETRGMWIGSFGVGLWTITDGEFRECSRRDFPADHPGFEADNTGS
jgi:hypothetical protein